LVVVAAYLLLPRKPPVAEAPPAVQSSPATAATARPVVVTDKESAPWPEREAPPAATKRPEPRPAAPAPVTPAAVRRAPAARHTPVARPAQAVPARKVTAAPAEPTHAVVAGASAADGILKRGQTAFDRGDYPEAVRRGREAIAAGGALGGHLLVGDAYYRLERFPDALREYQAALALDPGSASIKRRRDLAEKGAQQ
jgi:hypothetical protein